ncbi:MAG: hypothetical protein QF816_05435, partial [Candidatus Scalindua sp.]|nr:hypothetical protein [Candidatus Scalindua sp.]
AWRGSRLSRTLKLLRGAPQAASFLYQITNSPGQTAPRASKRHGSTRICTDFKGEKKRHLAEEIRNTGKRLQKTDFLFYSLFPTESDLELANRVASGDLPS